MGNLSVMGIYSPRMVYTHNIDPIAINIGSLPIHWYGVMYLIGFAGAWWLGTYRAKQDHVGWTAEQVGDLIFYGAMGVIVGGRLGYSLFYDFANLAAEPSHIIRIWEGGMSFHGGLIGVIIAMWLFGRKTKKHFLQVTDFAAVLAPIGLFTGRIGNFINGELWGKASDAPWAIIFETGRTATNIPRHPSMLYEAALEGLVLFTILFLMSRRPRPGGLISGLFLLFYGIFRFAVEFVRIPDEHLGYRAFDWLTQGQILSIPMILLGFALIIYSQKQKTAAPT